MRDTLLARGFLHVQVAACPHVPLSLIFLNDGRGYSSSINSTYVDHGMVRFDHLVGI